MENAVVLKHITKRFGEVEAVKNISLEIKEGEFLTLLGPSGCGKTTLLRIIAGFEEPDEGEVWISGKNFTNIPPEKRDVGMVFQNYALFPNMNVGQNIAFPMRIAKVPEDKVKKEVRRLLELVKLEGFENRRIDQLSGGQKQRIALARALAKNPKVLLLDEPLSALDAKVRKELRTEIRRLQQELKITTIYVTHDQEEALSMSDRIVVMNQGRPIQIGSPEEIYQRPENIFVADFIGTTNLIEGRIHEEDKEIFVAHTLKFRIPGDHKLTPGSKAILSMRPDLISITPVKEEIPEEYNIVEGEVNLITFLGSIVRISLRIAEDREFIIDMPAKEFVKLNLGKGSRSFAYFDPDAGFVLPFE